MLRRRKAKRRDINADPGGRAARVSPVAAADRLRDLAGALEERVLWRVADSLRAVAEVVRWPLERAAWALERRVLWPLRERSAGLELPSRAAGAAVLGVVALGAVAVGVLSFAGGSAEESAPPVAIAPAAAPAQSPSEEPAGASLEGVPPSFGSGGVAAGSSAGGDEVAVASSDVDAEVGEAAAGAGEEGAAATSSSGKPVPAGPAAMKVARRFSEAFVLYEIGERPARAMAVFAETATPRLATALAERPPRLPEGTAVPKARVLNLVPGPRSGKSYTVSASLLRVGMTSELRLQIAKQAGAWRVTDVRG